ncbi:MAG: thioesterase family protein [Ignavibacteriaceae bacterium]
MLQNKTEIRVRFADTDQMQFAYNGKYLEYFEVARTEMMRSIGLPYKQIEQNGFHMPVYEAYVRYKSPAFYDEVLVIESLVKEIPTLKVKIDHTIYSKDRDVLIAEGFIVLVFLKKETNKPVRPPEFFIEKIRSFYD